MVMRNECLKVMQPLGQTEGSIQSFLASHHRPGSARARTAAAASSPPERHQQLCTAHDVFGFFAQGGLDATPNLFHCVEGADADSDSDIALKSSIYDLRVVPRGQLPATYCTVTAAGVVQVAANGSNSFTPVGSWIRHSSMHHLFFAAFQQARKSVFLRRWHANARQQRFQRHRQQLARQLLLLKPPFARALLECRTKLRAVLAAGALEPTAPGLYKLEALVEQQQEYQQSKIAPLLARTAAALVGEVESLALRLQHSALMLGGELAEYRKDPSCGASRKLSPVKVKAEQDVVAAKHAAAMNDLQRLPAFIRLLTLNVMQTYLDLLVGAVAALKSHVESDGNLLLVNLRLEHSSVTFSPSMEQLLKGFSKGVIEGLVVVIKAAPRPLKHPSIAALLADPTASIKAEMAARNRCSSSSGGGCQAMLAEWAPSEAGGQRPLAGSTHSAGGGPAAGLLVAPAVAPLPAWLTSTDSGREGLLLMIVGDQSLADLRRSLDQQVMRSYREAQQVADTLADLSVPLLSVARAWNASGYKATPHTVAQLRKDTLLLRACRAELEAVAEHEAVGLLAVQTAELKSAYLQQLVAATAAACMKLVSAARREAHAALAQLQALSRELGQQPTRLPDFIAFKARLKEICQSKEEVAVARPAQVAAAYSAVTAWGSSLPRADQVLLDDVRDAAAVFSRSLTSALSLMDSRHLGMAALLERSAQDALKKVTELLRQLEAAARAQMLGTVSHEAPADDRLQLLGAWQQQQQQLAAMTALINSQEGQLGVKVTCFGDLLGEADKLLQEIAGGVSTTADEAAL